MKVTPRVVWRLLSPAREVLACEVVRTDGLFQLQVSRGNAMLMTYPGTDLGALHRIAAEWRTGLCARGYVVDAS